MDFINKWDDEERLYAAKAERELMLSNPYENPPYNMAAEIEYNEFMENFVGPLTEAEFNAWCNDMAEAEDNFLLQCAR